MSISPPLLLSLGVQIDPAAQKIVAIASRRIRPPTHPGGSNVEPSHEPASTGGSAGAFLSFAIFLCLTRINLVTRDTPRGKIILEGGKRSPAYTLYFAIENDKLGWLNRILFGVQIRSEFYRENIVRYSERGVYFIGWKHSCNPLVHVFKTPKSNSVIKTGDLDLGVDEPDAQEIWNCVSSVLKSVNENESTAVSASSWPEWCLLPLSDERPRHESQIPIKSQSCTKADSTRFSIWHSITLPFGGTYPLSELYCELQIEPTSNSSQSNPATNAGIGIDYLLNNLQRFTLITGEAGSGKSTLIKQILHLNAAQGKNPPMPARAFKLPEVYAIDSPDSASSETSRDTICKAIAKKIAAIEDSLNEQEEHLLIFDGLDELPDRCQRPACDLLSELSWRHAVIVASRPVPAMKNCMADKFEIVPLSRQSKIQLVVNICKHLKYGEGSNAILSEIQSNPKYLAMSGNPFLLSVLCTILIQNRNSMEEDYSSNNILKSAIDQILDDIELPAPRDEIWKIFCHQAFLYTVAGQTELRDRYMSERLELFTRSKLGSISKTTGHFEFGHQKIREFLAGMHIAQLSDGEILSLLDNYGLSKDLWEEWKVAVRAIDPFSGKGKIIRSWWMIKLNNPDMFFGVFCVAAEILSEWDLNDGGTHLLGINLYSNLWDNVDRHQWPLSSAKALVALDVKGYAKDLRDRLTRERYADHFHEAVFEFSQRSIPFDIQDQFNLLSLLNGKKLDSNFTPRENISILPLDSLERYRFIIRNRDLSLSERAESLYAILGNRSRFTLDDADYIFEEIPTVSKEEYYEYLYLHFKLLHITIKSVAVDVPPREAAQFLLDKLMKHFAIEESFEGGGTFLTEYLVFALRDGYDISLSKEIGPDIVRMILGQEYSDRVLNALTIILSYANINAESIRLVRRKESIRWDHILSLHQRSDDPSIISDLIAVAIESNRMEWLAPIKLCSRMPITPKNFESMMGKISGKKFSISLSILALLRKFHLTELQHAEIDRSIIFLMKQRLRDQNAFGHAEESLLYVVIGMRQTAKSRLSEILINRIMSKKYDYTRDLEVLANIISEVHFDRMWDFANSQEGAPCKMWGREFAHTLVRASPYRSLKNLPLANANLKGPLESWLCRWTEESGTLYFHQTTSFI